MFDGAVCAFVFSHSHSYSYSSIWHFFFYYLSDCSATSHTDNVPNSTPSMCRKQKRDALNCDWKKDCFTKRANEWTNERTHDGTNIVMECREHGYHVGNKSVYSSFLLSLFQQIIFCLLFDITSCIVCIRFGMWPSWAHCSNNQNRSIHFSNMITREFARIYVYILYVIPIFFGKILVHQLNVSMRN